MERYTWLFQNDQNDFDLGQSGAAFGRWGGSDALLFAGLHCLPVLLRKPIEQETF
ncbi:hypothetical protein [Paenibacillus koleovorans]|uniref:hypothetical protein n=1 Tax=Paenibacillus koleovorans TaxID=121608 RepID=UPI0013E338E7|nr:hypothetical protein [Paenibacillus koleovorans]